MVKPDTLVPQSEGASRKKSVGTQSAILDKTSIFTRFKNKRTPMIVTSWSSSDYFTMLPQLIDLGHTDYGAGWSDMLTRGHHATPSSMTKVDLRMYNIINAKADKLEKDEWVDAQHSNFIDKLLGDVMLVGILADQFFFHKMMPSGPEDDALGAGELKWDEDTIVSALNSLIRQNYLVHPFSLNILKSVCVYFKYESSYLNKNKPGGYFVPHSCGHNGARVTYAVWKQLKTYLKSITPSAELHSKRIKMPFKSLSEADVTSMWYLEPMSSLRGKLIQMCMVILGKDGGGNLITFNHNCMPRTGADGFDWTSMDLYCKETGDSPEDIWALLSFFCAWNDSTAGNNENCIKTIPPTNTTNSKYGIYAVGYDDVSAPGTERAFTTLFQYNYWRWLVPAESSMSHDNTGAAVTDTDSWDQLMIREFGEDHHKVDNPFSEGIWDEICEEVFGKFIDGQTLK